MRNPNQTHTGQSILEYVVVLALVAILIVTVVAGVGHRSHNRVTQTNEGLDEAAVAAETSSSKSAKPPVAGVASRPTVRPSEKP
jgi:Flp pilus assembly pilin Flp